jgi:hypothetical protein
MAPSFILPAAKHYFGVGGRGIHLLDWAWEPLHDSHSELFINRALRHVLGRTTTPRREPPHWVHVQTHAHVCTHMHSTLKSQVSKHC